MLVFNQKLQIILHKKYVDTEKAEGGRSMALKEHKIASKNCRNNVLKDLKRNKPMCELNIMLVKMMQNSSQLIQLVIEKQATFF